MTAREPSGEQTKTYLPGSSPAGPAGTVIAGRYKLLEQIGEGGMGSVWMADQLEPVKRRVAVKLIRAEREGSRMILSRFEAERQAIALMDHPHIAKLLDAGTTDDGHPFFVMELVKGVPLTEFCDEHRLSIPDRLQLFAQICDAVQHAHQKGIIHRDLKPTNILVEAHDGKPVPRVIDFGLAKALREQPLSEQTLFTGFGTVVGTPLYMAPEQAQFNAVDVDTRADIYALGVILYELLAGSTPIERETLRMAAFEEVLRLVRETEPPTPSKRLSSTEAKPNVAANRRSEPARLGRYLRGDLDWIVMKALAKERERRYETASGFAQDIERFLRHEPVVAGPPSIRYRLQKFVRRNRVQVIAASLVFLALVAGVAGTSLGLVNAERQRQKAVANEARATQAAGAERTAKEREAEQRASAERARDRAQQVLDDMTSSLAGDVVREQREITRDQKRFYAAVLEYYREFAAEKGDDRQARERTAGAAYRVALIEYRLGHNAEAAAACVQARDSYAALSSEFPADVEYRHSLAQSRHLLGSLWRETGKRDEAVQEHREANGLWEALAKEHKTEPKYPRHLAFGLSHLAVVLDDLGNHDEAEPLHLRALEIRKWLVSDFREEPAHRYELANSHGFVASIHSRKQEGVLAVEQHQLALALYEQLFKEFPQFPDRRWMVARTHSAMGGEYSRMGKRLEAAEENRQAREILDNLTVLYPSVASFHFELGAAHNDRGRYFQAADNSTAAQESYAEAAGIFKRLVEEFPQDTTYRMHLGRAYNNSGVIFLNLQNWSEAERLFREALTHQARLAEQFPKEPEYQIDLGNTHNNLGMTLAGLRRVANSRRHYSQALEIWKQLFDKFPAVPEYRSGLARGCVNLANLECQARKWPAADALYRRALPLLARLAKDSPTVPEFRMQLASCHYNLALPVASMGNLRQAAEECRVAVDVEQKLVDEFPLAPNYRRQLANSQTRLRLLLADLEKRTQMESTLRQAIARKEKLAAEAPEMLVHQVGLGNSHKELGVFFMKSGRFGESLGWFDKAIGTLTPLNDKDPPVENARQNLLDSHRYRAIAYVELEKPAAALDDAEQVIKLANGAATPSDRASRAMLRVKVGRVPEAIAEAAELAKLPSLSAAEWYNLACIYALAAGQTADKKEEYATAAFELLSKSAKAGLNVAEALAEDSDFDSLRDRDDFKQLLQELTKRK